MFDENDQVALGWGICEGLGWGDENDMEDKDMQILPSGTQPLLCPSAFSLRM